MKPCSKEKPKLTFASNQTEFSYPSDKNCNLIHVDDIELFREKALIGAVALEEMKEQIDILYALTSKYIQEVY